MKRYIVLLVVVGFAAGIGRGMLRDYLDPPV